VNGHDAPPALSERHVVDSTVWSKVRTKTRPDLAEWFNLAVQADLVATCDPVVLELLRSARDAAAFARQADLVDLLPAVPTGEPQFRRAREVQAALAGTGRQRGVPPIDLLIAASAETAGLPVLHYDHDYDLISSVSGQRCVWLLPPGTLP
jgi:predicted nucleic acid-binding protein